jgi:hypothetical protein
MKERWKKLQQLWWDICGAWDRYRTPVMTPIPPETWRKLYADVQPNQSTSVQVTDIEGLTSYMLEGHAEVDKILKWLEELKDDPKT